tara:strand:+ start:214 stop:996 length:783 start_codon:yes stop_codon:yes gene_type:complete
LPKNILLQFDQVSYRLNEKFINENISFSIKNGELISIIGPNGSGKTTMLRLMSGEINPTLGTVYFKNKNLLSWDIKELAKYRSVLSQSDVLSFPFTVKDIISMGRYPFNNQQNLDVAYDRMIIDDMIDYFDLKEFSNRNYLTLSGGEKQRVQLARVFSQICDKKNINNKLIMLDEPVSFLDIYHQIKLYDLIRKLNKQGLTVVMVLHDLNHALSYSKKVMMLKKSKLEYSGLTKDTINKNTIQEIFKINSKSSFYNQNFQ